MPTKVSKPASTSHLSAMPEVGLAICFDPEGVHTPAIIFNEKASPGALVSWAWSQLAILNGLLLAQADLRTSYEEGDVGEAVRTMIGPVMDALQLSELRAEERRNAAELRPSK